MKEIVVAIIALLVLSLPLFGDGHGTEPEERKMPSMQVVQPEVEETQTLPGIEKVPEDQRERVEFWVRLNALKAGMKNPAEWLKETGGDLGAIIAKIPEDWEPNPEELKKAEENLKPKKTEGKIPLVAPGISTEPAAETPAEAVDDAEIPEPIEDEIELQPGQ